MRIDNNADTKKAWDHFNRYHDIESRNILIEHYLPLVKYTAQRLGSRFPKSIELDDLYSAGIMGLIGAIERYDPSRPNAFESYCVQRIQGAILDDIRREDWVPRLVRSRAHILGAMIQRLDCLYGRYPTDQELAEALEMEMEEFYNFQRDANICCLLSLDANLSDGSSDTKFSGMDYIAELDSDNPSNEVNRRDLWDYVKRGFSRQEQNILILYYLKGMTMREIGETLGKSESRISQLHTSIIVRLRHQVKAGALCTFESYR